MTHWHENSKNFSKNWNCLTTRAQTKQPDNKLTKKLRQLEESTEWKNSEKNLTINTEILKYSENRKCYIVTLLCLWQFRSSKTLFTNTDRSFTLDSTSLALLTIGAYLEPLRTSTKITFSKHFGPYSNIHLEVALNPGLIKCDRSWTSSVREFRMQGSYRVRLDVQVNACHARKKPLVHWLTDEGRDRIKHLVVSLWFEAQVRVCKASHDAAVR